MVRRLPLRSLLLGLVAIALLLLLPHPVRANQIQVWPLNPQLGDTISVVIPVGEGQSAPTVTLGEKVLPSFPVSSTAYRALLPTTPLDPPGRLSFQVNWDNDTQTVTLGLRNRRFPTQRIWVRGAGSNGTPVEMARVQSFKEVLTPQKLWQGRFDRPSGGRLSSPYGVRRYYNGRFARDYYHRGVDYAAPTGTPIVAPAAGRVVLVGRESQGFRLHGNTIGLDHGQGVTSIFIHLSRIDVQEGDVVQPGQRLGAIGATGSATGPNLHWGLFVHGKAIDPRSWLETGFN